MDIGDEEGLPVETDLVPTSRLYAADEIFLTSTAGGVIPVATLDGSPVGQGRPGPIMTRIRQTYWAWHNDARFVTAVEYE